MGFPLTFYGRYVNAVCFLFVLEILEAHDFYYFWMLRNIYFSRRSVLEGGSLTLYPLCIATLTQVVVTGNRISGTWHGMESSSFTVSLSFFSRPGSDLGRNPQSISCVGCLFPSPPPRLNTGGKEKRQQGEAVNFRVTYKTESTFLWISRIYSTSRAFVRTVWQIAVSNYMLMLQKAA